MVGAASVFLGSTGFSSNFYRTSGENGFCRTISNNAADTSLDCIPGTVCCIYMGADCRCIICDQITIGVSQFIK